MVGVEDNGELSRRLAGRSERAVRGALLLLPHAQAKEVGEGLVASHSEAVRPLHLGSQGLVCF